MNLQQLEAFEAIARTRSIAQAARELYSSQQALSKMLKALETELNIELFERNGSHLAITEAGKTLLHYAGIANNAIEEANAQIKDLKQARESTVRVIFRVPVGNLSSAISGYANDNPNTTIHVATENEVGSDFDLEVLLGNGDFQDGDYACEEKWGLIVPKSHPLASKNSVSLSCLKSESLALCSSDAEMLRNACEDRGVTPPRFNLVCQQAWAIVEYALKSQGLAFGPIVTYLNGNKGQLTGVPIEELDLRANISIRGNQETLSRAAVELKKHLRDHLYASEVNNCSKWTTSSWG